MSVSTVDVLDGLLLRAQLVAVPWIKRRSWRSGLAAERLVQSVHEALRRTARRAGWLRRHRLVHDEAGEPQGPMPAYPDFVPRVPGVSKHARLLVAGEWHRRDGSIGSLQALSWVDDGYGNTSSLDRLDFHALRWAVDLFDAFDATQDRDYLCAGVSLVRQWIRECLDCEDAGNVWSDHATALRAIVLCQAWCRGRLAKLLDTEAAGELLETASRHARKLALECFYRPDHDHGVTQAYGQLALGLCFGHAPDAPAWVAQGLARLERQMEDNVSTEGILKEHSPYYQLYVLQQFYYAYEFGRRAGVSFSPRYVARLSQMAAAAIGSMKPDGTLPAFGDTSKSSAIVIDPLSILSSLEKTALAADAKRGVWMDGGYAVFRSAPDSTERAIDERFLMVRFANFPMPHLHDDLLSFEFYAYGDDLIVDSGGPFQYGHPARTGYFTRVAAHNTVVIEGADEHPVGRARVISSDSLPGHDILVAEHIASPGVLHIRALCFVHSGYLVLLDIVKSRVRRRVRSLLHINPALDVFLDGNCLRTTHPNAGAGLSVLSLDASGVTASLVRGAQTPMQGWICGGANEMKPGTVLEYASSGTHVVLGCVIVAAGQPGSSAARATVTGNLAEFTADIAVDLENYRDEIMLSNPWRIRIARSAASRIVG